MGNINGKEAILYVIDQDGNEHRLGEAKDFTVSAETDWGSRLAMLFKRVTINNLPIRQWVKARTFGKVYGL